MVLDGRPNRIPQAESVCDVLTCYQYTLGVSGGFRDGNAFLFQTLDMELDGFAD